MAGRVGWVAVLGGALVGYLLAPRRASAPVPPPSPPPSGRRRTAAELAQGPYTPAGQGTPVMPAFAPMVLQPYPGKKTEGAVFTLEDGTTHRAVTPSGPRVVQVETPVRPCSAFAAAIIAQLMGAGVSRAAAELFAAHCCLETSCGRDVWDYDVANVKDYDHTDPTRPWGRRDYAGRPDNDTYRAERAQAYLAFPTVQAGIAGAVRSVRRGYPAAWAAMLAADPNWYGIMNTAPGRSYSEYPSAQAAQRNYLSVLSEMQSCLRKA